MFAIQRSVGIERNVKSQENRQDDWCYVVRNVRKRGPRLLEWLLHHGCPAFVDDRVLALFEATHSVCEKCKMSSMMFIHEGRVLHILSQRSD